MHLHVVIADQDVKLAKLYCRFLADHGISAETAVCGLECLGIMRHHVPDVLVLDRELPWRDARGVLACLREDGLSLPVILTTWSTSQDAVRWLVVPPIVLCLRKFFPLPALLEGIHFAVNSYGSQDLFSESLQLSQQGDPTWSTNR